MITEKDITDMYVHLRKTNQSIPDEALEFMKMVCMDNLKFYQVKNFTTLQTRIDDFGIKLDVRENFRDKDNRGSVLSLTPHDLEDYQRVGAKLMHFGRQILEHDTKSN